MSSPQRTTTFETRQPSRRTFLHWAAAAGAAAAGAPLLAACADRSTAAGPGLSDVKLIHPSKDPLVLWAATYLAEDDGYYKDEGLSVERVLLGGGPAALTGLLSGAGHVNLSAPGELLSAVGKGQQLTTLLAHTNSMPSTLVISKAFAQRVGVTADSSLEQRQAAIGKVKDGRFGITAPGSQTDGFTRLALKQAGLEPGRDAQIVPLQTSSNSMAALANGQIDGFIGVPPLGQKAVLEFEAVPLLVNQLGEIEGADRLQGMTMEARTADVEANPELYQALVSADIRALRMLVENPDEAGALLRKTRFGNFEEPLWNVTWKMVQKSWGSPYITRESLKAWFDNGLVTGASVDEFPFDEVVDMRFVDKALAESKWSPAKQ